MKPYTAYRVIAACRKPDQAEHLHKLKEQSEGRLDLLQMDITDEQSIQVGLAL